jgi:hypothetical protein
MRAAVLIAMVITLLCPALATAVAPRGWFLAGSDPASYEMQRDSATLHGGKTSMRLASTREPRARQLWGESGFGTAMQCIDAGDYLGKRVRYSGFIRARDVRNWAGLWMRVDGQNPSTQTLAFDNMQNRPIMGTQDWKRFEVVLDVAPEARAVCFGILLSSTGTVWLSDVGFEVVPKTVPTTDTMKQNRKPVNLDFEH